MLSSHAGSPFVAGIMNPRVYIPEGVVQASGPDELARVLIHELAHVQQKDSWVLVLQELVTLPFWFHPLVHWMNRELDRAREELCDNHVLRDSQPTDYARTLLQLAQRPARRPGLAGALSILWPEHRLVSRIRLLLDRRRDRRTFLGTGPRLLTWSCIALLTLGTSLVRVDVEAGGVDTLGKTSKPAEYQFIDIHPQFAPAKINARGQVAGRLVSANPLKSQAAIWSREQGLRGVRNSRRPKPCSPRPSCVWSIIGRRSTGRSPTAPRSSRRSDPKRIPGC